MEAYQVALIATFALAILELLTGSFIFLGLAAGALAVAGVQWAAGGASLNRDILVFAVASVLATIAFRRFFRRSRDQDELRQEDINRY